MVLAIMVGAEGTLTLASEAKPCPARANDPSASIAVLYRADYASVLFARPLSRVKGQRVSFFNGSSHRVSRCDEIVGRIVGVRCIATVSG